MPIINFQSNLSTAKFRQYVLQFLQQGITTSAVPNSPGYNLFHHSISAATTNDTNVKNSAALVGAITVFHVGNGNTNRYCKIYNKATAPTASDVPVLTLVIHPGDTAVITPATPLYLSNGLGFRMTANYADNDNTAISANELAINIAYA